MKYILKLFPFVCILTTFNPSNTFSQDLTPEQIYEKVNDCVVVILSYDFDGKLSKQGSGVVISDKGWVVTNYHVFAECEKIEIKHNDKIIRYSDIIGVDVEKDILILKIDENIFPTIEITSTDNLKVGQKVYAIGSPLGMENSLSEGLISGLRNVTKENRNFIQITAAISQGSSGGAVVNSKGELIGISTLSLINGQNLNFAIPSKDIFEIPINLYNDKKIDIDAKNYFYKGYNAAENGNYIDAIKYYTKFIDIFPVASGFKNRGYAYLYLNEYEKAISDFNKVIILLPYKADAYTDRGNAYREFNKYNNAISDYNKALEIEPDDAIVYCNLALVYKDLKEYDKAISNYNKAIEIDPDNEETFLNRGQLYLNLKKYDKAIYDFNEAILINPGNSLTYMFRGITYSNLNMFSLACEDFKKANSLGAQGALQFIQSDCR